LAQTVYFTKYYKEDIYGMTSDIQAYCQKAYKGGMCDTFKVGKFNNVLSIDINSSYPCQMIRDDFPTGPYSYVQVNKNITEIPYLQPGIYEIVILSSPNTKFPLFCDKVDGKLLFANFKNHKTHATSEEIEYGR
jgi:hypothetical protein